MNTSNEKAMRLALEALESTHDVGCNKTDEAITSLRQAIAEAEDNYQGSDAAKAAHMMDLYTALGVRWGEDPFAVIAKMRSIAEAEKQPTGPATSADRYFYEAGFEAGRQQGMKQERALWELARIGQEIEAEAEKQEPVFWYRPVGEDGGYEGPLHNGSKQGEPHSWYSAQEDEWMTDKTRKDHERLNSYTHKVGGFDLPLYTTPYVPEGRQQRKPLTDEQIDKAMAENKQTLIDAADNYWKMRRAYARIIEAAHGIKE